MDLAPLFKVEPLTRQVHEEFNMKYLFAFVVMGVLGASGLVGCSDETKATKTETIKTPEGKTTVTDEKKVESSGKNPPKTP